MVTSGISDSLIQIPDRLTQLTIIVAEIQQALPHKLLRDLAPGPPFEAAAPDCPLENRQNPDQDLGIAALHRVRHGSSRIDCHDTTMPQAYDLALGTPSFQIDCR
jgi:hypothetical protein